MNSILLKHEKTKELIDNKTLNKAYKHANHGFLSHAIALDFITHAETIFVVCANLYDAQIYYDYLSNLVNKDDLLFFPSDQILTMMMALGSPEFRSERLFTIQTLLKEDKKIVVTTMLAAQLIQLSKEDYLKATKSIHVGDRIEIDKLTKQLVYSGYQKSFTVEFPGTFSVRGSIVDVFPLNALYPYRIDFFDLEIEAIKRFDIETQRSFETVDFFELLPMQELFFTDEIKTKLIRKINHIFVDTKLSQNEKNKIAEDLESIENRTRLEALNYYIQFVNDKPHTILDFVEHKKIYIIDIEKMFINETSMQEDLQTYAQTVSGQTFKDHKMFVQMQQIVNQAHNIIDLKGFSDEQALSLGVLDVNQYQGNLPVFFMDYEKSSQSKPIFIFVESNTIKDEILKFFKEKNISIHTRVNEQPGFYLIEDKIVSSFETSAYVMIETASLYNRKIRKAMAYRSVLNQTTKIRHVDELSPLDYVVHYDYGVGRYLGLKTMELSGHKKDYLHIVFLNDESLYVPMEQIELVLKYRSHDGAPPKLSKMGGKIWDKTKQSARMKIKDLSDRLIKLYAKRNEATGYHFSKDTPEQIQFENDFSYDTTTDQARAILETKFDMESTRPMDRLICGDVGFGKTEVALRASFKAVMDQKQVMYLVPTTVLARQHYYTYKDRFDKFGANVALLNRFTKAKEQKEILEKLKKGLIDVVIGTHRLLSNDVVFKDLGLLIVDEEQRFGVEHKERIKEIKHNVDALTLTATPIPRTLQMSLLGLKDLSMIETPPLNRYPVQTYVVEKQDALIKEAIRREIARGGQVFYLLNKIHLMDKRVSDLKQMIPEANITYVHGKMKRDDIEGVISDFSEHRFDILVATTIIETGIDMPNTNTLIIEDSDTLGLSQLYQIRGRVGRSDKIAYAYLLYDKHKHINEEAKKRLLAIEDFTALGSGYKIAIRDLSIRGAGDILGAEQSGFIDSVGIELYQKLLEEALTGKNVLEDVRKDDNKDTYAPRHIEPEYIVDEKVRIEIHKRIGSIKSIADLDDLTLELEDRFGKVSPDLMLYMYEKLFKIYSHHFEIEKTSILKDVMSFTFKKSASEKINGIGLFEIANTYPLSTKLKRNRDNVMIEVSLHNQKAHWLFLAIKFFDDNREKIFK